MKKRIAQKIKNKDQFLEKVILPKIDREKSQQHKNLILTYEQDNQQKILSFSPKENIWYYKAQSLLDTKGQPLTKADPSKQITLAALLKLDPNGERTKVLRPGEYVNQKAQAWLSKSMVFPIDVKIKDMPQGWSDLLGEDFNPAGLSPQALAQMLVDKKLAKLPEPKAVVVKDLKPKAEKKPRVKTEKVVNDTPQVNKQPKEKIRTERKEKPLLALAADLRINSFDLDMFDEAIVGKDGKSGLTLTFVNRQQEAICDVVLFAEQGFAAYQIINYHTGTSKTLLYSQKNNPKGARGDKTLENYNGTLPENTTKGLYTHNLQLIYQQQNPQKEKQGLSFLYEFQNVPWQNKSVVPPKIAEADITKYLLDNEKNYTYLPTQPLAEVKTKKNNNKDIIREKWEEQILPFSAEYDGDDKQSDLPHSVSTYMRQDDGIFDIDLAINKTIDEQRRPAQKANSIKRAAGQDVTQEDIKAAHASPMLQLMRNAMMNVLAQENSTKKMAYYLAAMVDMGKEHFSQQPDNITKLEAV